VKYAIFSLGHVQETGLIINAVIRDIN